MKRNKLSLETSSIFSRHAKTIIFVHLCVGSMMMSVLEGWSLADGLYFAITTLTTIGFGDVVPKSGPGKLFAVLYISFGAIMTATCLGALVGHAAASDPRRASRLGPRQRAGSVAAMLIGAATMWGLCVEEWSLIDSLYWAVASCTSVGYGDIVPSQASRLVTGVFLLCTVVGFAGSAGALVKAQVDAEVARQVEAFVSRGVSEQLIEEIDADGNGRVDRAEFLKYMLIRGGKVEDQEIAKVT